jgi:hypothetical protein
MISPSSMWMPNGGWVKSSLVISLMTTDYL